MEIPIVSGVDCIRNPLINSGEGNFIQIYFNNLPYFRAGEEKHHTLLEKFLKEANITNYETHKDHSFIPSKKGSLYELVGAGTISEATVIKENMRELYGRGHIAIGGYSENYKLYPSIEHISKILNHFEDPLIFVGSDCWTEEKINYLGY
jgi:hypothetical protein